jgi:type I restriction enzyme R subunit
VAGSILENTTANKKGCKRMTTYKAVAESNNFIVLDKYVKNWQVAESYQSEGDLERELIQDLSNQGYEYLSALTTPDAMLANVRKQLQALNKVEFTDAEWARFCEQYLNTPSDNILDKTRKVHSDYIFDFVFDDGHIENIYLFDKKTIARNYIHISHY